MQTSLFTATTELDLSNLRTSLARTLNMDASKVWSNKAMQELLSSQPKTIAELVTIKGLTKKKVQEFGAQIIAIFGGEAVITSSLSEMKASITLPQSKPIPTPTRSRLSGTAATTSLNKGSRDKFGMTENFGTSNPGIIDAEAEIVAEEEITIAEKVLGVGDYLDYINHILKIVGDVKVIGEISKLTNHPTGVYMTLKDKNGDGVLDCYINPYTYRGLGLRLEEGMEVKASGIPGIFKRRSQLSLKVESVELAGEGSLKKAYELMKAKLEEEGMFDRKRELPEFITSLGIITSKTGAVIDDFRNNLRKLGCKLYLKDCRVEGNQAANQIIRAIKYFNIYQADLDCIIIMRGGGSLEDMQAFNSEAVIKEVFASRIPVIAAIGHDRDVPLTCLAADCYTSTPTAAAVLINNSWGRLFNDMPRLEQVMLHKFSGMLGEQNNQLTNLVHQLTGSFNAVFQKFKHLEEKLLRGYGRIINSIHHTKQKALNIMTQVTQRTARDIQHATDTIAHAEKLLATASPERNLRLGYSLAYTSSGKLIRSTTDTTKGDTLDIKLADGTINTEVI